MDKSAFTWSTLIASIADQFPELTETLPWNISLLAAPLIQSRIDGLSKDYVIKDSVAIHRSSVVESNVIFKGPVIIGPDCFIAAHAYLRGGVFLMSHNSVGPGCEIKSSVIFSNTNLAHFNFVGDSIVGSNVNFEAGAVVANHFNERNAKEITVKFNGEYFNTGVEKFGALIGDGCKIGANAVLSPGTILLPSHVVKRLELVDQLTR